MQAKPGQATLFSTCVEISDSRRVIWKRGNDSVAWSGRVFVRNRGNGSEKRARVGNGCYASSVVTKRRVTSFRKAAWRKRTGIRGNDLSSVIVRWEEICRIRGEHEAIDRSIDRSRSCSLVLEK